VENLRAIRTTPIYEFISKTRFFSNILELISVTRNSIGSLQASLPRAAFEIKKNQLEFRNELISKIYQLLRFICCYFLKNKYYQY
jgi:hypothetical protein